MRDFISFYEEALARRGMSIGDAPGSRPALSAAPARVPVDRFTKLSKSDYKPKSEDLDPVSWVIDMISRGAYGSAQVATNFVDEYIQGAKNVQEGGNPLVESLLSGLRATGKSMGGEDSFSRAAMWNDPERKRLGSDVIEESTDKAGEAFNPAYQNRVDNVDPRVKGWLGLLGDVFTDPSTYVPGAVAVKPVVAGAKVLGKTIKPLGFTEGKAGVAAYEAEKQAARDAGLNRAQQGAPAPGAATPPTPPPGAVPGAAPPPRPPSGAPGVVANSVPVPNGNAFSKVANFFSNLRKAPAADAAGTATLKTQTRAAASVPLPPKPRTAHREMADADANLRRTAATVEASITARAAERNAPDTLKNREAVAEQIMVRDEAEAAAKKAAASPQEKQANVDWLLSPEGRAASPQGAAIVEERLTPSVPVREPMPEGAVESLNALMAAQQRKGTGVLHGPQGKILATNADNGITPDEATSLLKREYLDEHIAAGTTDALPAARKRELAKHKPLDEADHIILDDLRDAAARGLHEAEKVKNTTIAVTVANDMPADLIERAGTYVSVVDLHEAVTQSAYITRMRTFLRRLQSMVNTQMDAPIPFQGRLKGKIETVDGKVIGTGIFRPEYDDLRASAMHFWLSPDGALAREYANTPLTLKLSSGVEHEMTVAEMAHHVDALDNPANETMLRNLSTGHDYVAPRELSPLDADITRAIWDMFYEDVTKVGVTGHGAEEAFHIANALQALQYSLKYDYALVEKGVGAATAEALGKVFGGNPARAVEHFKALVALQHPTFDAKALDKILRETSVYNVPGTRHNQMRAVFQDAGLLRQYEQYERFQALKEVRPDITDEMLEASRAVDEAVETAKPKRKPKKGQEPTPIEAIPEDVPPAVGADIATTPSNTPAHHVGPEAVLAKIAEMRQSAAGSPKEVWYGAVLDHLTGLFHKTVEKPRSLPLTTTSGVKVTSPLPDSLGWRTDLWNMPKQTEFINSLADLMNKNSEAVLTASKSKYRSMRGDSRKDTGVMPVGLRRAFEEQQILEALDITDTFLASVGVRQVIGTSVEDAIPISIGDILHTIVAHTDGTKTFGALGPQIRQMMFWGAQYPGAPKVNLTNFAEAVRLRLMGEPEDVVRAQLLNTTKLGKRGELVEEGVMPNNWTGEVQGSRIFNLPKVEEGKTDPWLDIFPNAEYRKDAKGGFNLYIPGDEMADAMMRMIDDSIEDIGKVAINNQWRGANAVMEQKDIVLDEMSRKIMGDLATSPEKMPELVRYLATLEKTASGIVAREGMYPAAGKIGVEEVSAQVGPDTVRSAKSQVAIANSETPGAPPKQRYAERRNAINKEQAPAVAEVQEQANQIADDAYATLLENPEIRAGLEDLDSIQPPPAQATGLPGGPPKPPKPPKGGPPKIPMGPGGGTPPAGAVPPPNPKIATATAAVNAVSDTYDIAAPYLNAYLNSWGMLALNIGKKFNASLGMPGLWQGLHAGGVLANSYLAKVSTDLSRISKEYDKATLKTAYDSIVSGTPSTDPLVQKAALELNDKLGLLWGTHGGSTTLGHTLLNSDPIVTHLNSMMRKYFPPDGSKNQVNKVPQFDLDAATVAMNAQPGLTLGDALAAQWRTWDVADPADFLLRMMSAAVNTAEHRAVVNLFNRNMKAWGGVSDVKLPGWSRPSASGDSAFIHFIDQNMYYPDELLRELHHADIFASTSKQIANEAGGWVRRNYVPWLNAWKRGMTINRLGHHVRTQIGDTFLTYVVRGHNQSGHAAMDATKLMAMTNSYQDMDFMAMLNALHDEGAKIATNVPHPRAGEVAFTGHVGGKQTSYTLGMAADAIHRNGLKPTYHMGEGLYENPATMTRFTKLAKVASLEDTKYGRLAGSLSQGRDHWTRAQHFMQIMRQEMGKGTGYRKQFAGKWSTVEELEKLAAREVKKYHPDASMLTGFEAKYMRLLIPFYSWMSKILPAFFESFIRNPGRISMMSKASYEAAVANGLNPDSVYDPFPTDQMFPSYMEAKALGPQFQMFGMATGINPGIPQFDILNQFLGNKDPENDLLGGVSPLLGIASMLTPILRVPAEYIAESSFGGVPIKDVSDYLDSQIPGGSYAASITGFSPSSALTLEGWRDEDKGTWSPFEKRRMVREEKYQGAFNAGGMPSGDALTSLLNWITGLGFSGMGHVNQRNFAEIEARNSG